MESEVIDLKGKEMSGIYDAREYLKSIINDYKYGIISGDEFCRTVQEYIAADPFLPDEDLRRVVCSMFPEICRAYAYENVPEKERDLKFWIGLKDCYSLIERGWTFSEEREEYFKSGFYRRDPVEYTDEYLAVEPEMERLVRAEVGEGGYLGFVHEYDSVKKRVLKERYGIGWKTTRERYPGLLID